MKARFFVYILANQRRGVLYVGVTNNLPRRVWEHKTKIVPGFTRSYGVTKLVYFEEHASILEAREREHLVAVAAGMEIQAHRRIEPRLARSRGRIGAAVIRVPRTRCSAPALHR